jgi:homoserine acetyltransferase
MVSHFSALNSHMVAHHHVTITKLLDGTCPLCGESIGTAQGLAWHVSKEHRVRSTALAVAETVRMGDPAGVLTKGSYRLGL